MELIDEIAKVKKPSHSLIPALAEQYSAIAFKFGYFEAQSPCWLYFMRKEGEALAFELQFGNISEFKSSFDRLVKSKAQLCIFVTSSLAHTMKLEDARGLLLRNFEIGKQKFVLIDIENGRHVKANFEWDNFNRGITGNSSGENPQGPGASRGKPLFREARRKKIFGKRGEHKEQD